MYCAQFSRWRFGMPTSWHDLWWRMHDAEEPTLNPTSPSQGITTGYRSEIWTSCLHSQCPHRYHYADRQTSRGTSGTPFWLRLLWASRGLLHMKGGRIIQCTKYCYCKWIFVCAQNVRTHSRTATATDIHSFLFLWKRQRDKEIQSVQIALSICITVLNPPTAALIIYNINISAYIYIYIYIYIHEIQYIPVFNVHLKCLTPLFIISPPPTKSNYFYIYVLQE
jgi:hypothetical protein